MSTKKEEPSTTRSFRRKKPGSWIKRGGRRLVDRSDRFLARFKAAPVAIYPLRSIFVDGRFNWTIDMDERRAFVAAAEKAELEALASASLTKFSAQAQQAPAGVK